MQQEFDFLQLKLLAIRDELCGGNAAQLARDIGRKDNYVNRLLYPIGKKGRKGIGLAIMKACNAKYQLPKGYWDTQVDSAPLDGQRAGPEGQETEAVEKASNSRPSTASLHDFVASFAEGIRAGVPGYSRSEVIEIVTTLVRAPDSNDARDAAEAMFATAIQSAGRPPAKLKGNGSRA